MKYRRRFCLLIACSIICIYGLFTRDSATPTADVQPRESPVKNRPVDRNRGSRGAKTDDRALRRTLANSSDETCKKRLPQCIMIGMEHSGTTTLITFLNYHPQIVVNEIAPSELDFFNHKYENGLDWYRQQMKCSFSNQVTMEKSPWYYICSKCPKLIYEMNRDIKLLLIVKDPITRTVSQYITLLRRIRNKGRNWNTSIEEMLIDPGLGSKISNFNRYSHHLQNWLAYFSMDQIHVVDGHAFQDNPASELRGVEKYLGIEPFFKEEQFVLDPIKGKYCFKRDQVLACMPSNKGRPHPSLSPKTFKNLKESFHPMNEEFYEMIGRRFNWGY